MRKMTPVREKMIIIRDSVIKESKDLKSTLENRGWWLSVSSSNIYLVTHLSIDSGMIMLSHEDSIPLSIQQIIKLITEKVQKEIDRRTLAIL